jgi:murein DD-endopeptidase MepM/ murein hydrolase activator NlpD
VKPQPVSPLRRRLRQFASGPRRLLATAIALLCGLPDNSALAALPGLQLDRPLRQGELVSGRSAHLLEVDGRLLRRGPNGEVAFGLGRDQRAVELCVDDGQGNRQCERRPVEARSWRTENVSGLPPKTVDPDPETAARIAREAQRVAQARTRNDARIDFLGPWQAPARGRISGVYGSQRIRNGVPGSPHYGHDIAAPTGTPVLAAATGVVSLVGVDMVLPGNTVLIDHGHGVSSVYIHLSRIDVAEGQRVQAGDVIGAIGATGRASGPHLHWGLNWFDIKLDPAPLLGD